MMTGMNHKSRETMKTQTPVKKKVKIPDLESSSTAIKKEKESQERRELERKETNGQEINEEKKGNSQ